MESERCGTQEYYGFHLVLNLANFCVDFASIFDPKSWSQTKKLELVLFKLKFREPLYLLEFPGLSTLGAQTDSNRRHSEPQSDALTN